MEKKAKVPKLRFPGFTGEWKARKLGTMTEIGDIDHRMPSTVENGIPYLMTGDFCGINELNFDNAKRISKDDYVLLSKKIKPQKGDIIFARYASVGAVRYIDFTKDFLISYSCAIIKSSNQIFSKYLYHFLTSPVAQKQIKLEINTGSQANIGIDSMKNNIVVSMPLYNEQALIAHFLSNLDTLITLHQRKMIHLQTKKKSLLQKMFPKKGECFPELRFPGFTDAWEQRKLDLITDVRDGTHASPQYVVDGHPFVTSKNVKEGYINYDDIQFISDLDFEEINKRSKVDINDILMGMIGTIGNIAIVRENPDFAIKNVALIKDTGDVFYRYLYYCLQSKKVVNQLSENLDGGTQKFIALNKVRNLNIPLPSKKEQHKIGNYFENLDNLITLHQRKLTHLKTQKKALLQQMFV